MQGCLKITIVEKNVPGSAKIAQPTLKSLAVPNWESLFTFLYLDNNARK
jgi:hypothetical protein